MLIDHDRGIGLHGSGKAIDVGMHSFSRGELSFQLCIAEFLEALQGLPLLGLTPLHSVPKMLPSSSNLLDAMASQTLVTQITR
jgi:hypothetical protein